MREAVVTVRVTFDMSRFFDAPDGEIEKEIIDLLTFDDGEYGSCQVVAVALTPA